MYCQERSILDATLNEAHMSTINVHPLCNRFLTETRSEAVVANICAEQFTDIHPQLRNRSRITVLRIIIRE